jgi:adenylate cyclase
MKFCGKCGQEIHPSCPHCGFTNPPNFKFCGNCGCELSVGKIATIDIPPQSEEISVAEDRQDENTCYGPDSERKCVTVMFSDLTGYTEMSEKLDPEEVKEITSAIFGELTKIIEKYDGFIEKYIGDAILAVFGAKEAFEDSALRAIKAAREIHAHVESVSPKYEKLIGRALTMHTGINTGVVVTGEINFEKGTHGLVGDTINTAARLMSVSNPGEIVVDKIPLLRLRAISSLTL